MIEAPRGNNEQKLQTPPLEKGEPSVTSGTLRLVTMEQLYKLPPGTQLVCTTGEKKTIGVDRYVGDERGGFSEWGFLESDEVPLGVQLDTNGYIKLEDLSRKNDLKDPSLSKLFHKF